MARAKRTDRAEARRKYRAYLQAQEDAAAAEGQEESGPTAGAPSRSARGAERPQPNVQPGVRLGIMAAARGAYHRPTYLDDILHIRSLVFGSHAIWPVVAICAAAGAYLAGQLNSNGSTSDSIAPLLFQFIFYPVPLLPPMLAGFLAPRSTWLAGALASMIATTTLIIALVIAGVSLSSTPTNIAATPSPAASAIAAASATPSPTAVLTTSPGSGASVAPSAAPAATPTPAASPAGAASGTTGSTKPSDLIFVVLILLAQSLAFGALMGALSGWYKRFLALTSGPRNTPSRRGGGRPQQRRPAPRKKPA